MHGRYAGRGPRTILGSLVQKIIKRWMAFGLIVGCCWDLFWVDFGFILGLCWIPLGSFWGSGGVSGCLEDVDQMFCESDGLLVSGQNNDLCRPRPVTWTFAPLVGTVGDRPPLSWPARTGHGMVGFFCPQAERSARIRKDQKANQKCHRASGGTETCGRDAVFRSGTGPNARAQT